MAFAPAVWLAVQSEFVGYGDVGGSAPRGNVTFDDFDDEALFKIFHLTRPCINFITDNVRLRMKGAKQTIKPGVSVEEMVMTTLNYYAHGVSSIAIQEQVGINHLDSPEVICTVSKLLADMAAQFITFPFARDDRAKIAHKIEAFCGIPDVLGILACGHFKIRASPTDKGTFLNTWSCTTIMTQIICDCDGNILNVEKCCAGSAREQEIWDSSFKGREMEGDLYGKSWVIGGKGYRLSKHVLTAVSQPANTHELHFNEAHAKALEVMQKMLDSMKRRFKCLTHLGFAQENSLDKKFDIIKACCVLHNMAKKFSVPFLPVIGIPEPLHPHPLNQHQTPVGEISSEAESARQLVVKLTFKAPAGPAGQDPATEHSTVENA